MRGTKLGLQLCLELFVHCFRDGRLRFAIDAQNLLADGVGPAGKDACLGGSRPTLDAENAGDIDTLASEVGDERVASGVIADSADGKHACAEGGKIVGGVGAAAGSEMRFAMAEDEDGGFA